LIGLANSLAAIKKQFPHALGRTRKYEVASNTAVPG
jgi:hypothetical protein